MTEEQLDAFLLVAELRSVTRAAERLGVAQPTISDRLHALEREMRIRLLRRRGRGVDLTPAGTAALPSIRRARTAMTASRDAARGAALGVRGRIRLATTVTAGACFAAPAVAAFQMAHPDVEVRVRSVHTDDALTALVDDEADLAITSGPLLHARVERLHRARHAMAFVAAKGHALAKCRTVTVEALRATTLYVSAWGPAYRRFLDDIHQGETMPARWTEASPVELVKGLVSAGAGVAVVPAVAVEAERADGRLVALEIEKTPLPVWSVDLYRRRAEPASAAEAAFVKELVRALSPTKAAGD